MSSMEKQLSKECIHKLGDDWSDGCCTTSVLTSGDEQSLNPVLLPETDILSDVNTMPEGKGKIQEAITKM